MKHRLRILAVLMMLAFALGYYVGTPPRVQAAPTWINCCEENQPNCGCTAGEEMEGCDAGCDEVDCSSSMHCGGTGSICYLFTEWHCD